MFQAEKIVDDVKSLVALGVVNTTNIAKDLKFTA